MDDYTMFRIIILCLVKLLLKYFHYFCRSFYNERNYEDVWNVVTVLCGKLDCDDDTS